MTGTGLFHRAVESSLPYTSYRSTDHAIYSDDAPHCANCGSAVGLPRLLPPYRLVLEQHGGDRFEDIVIGAGGGDFLVSDRLLDWWNKENLTGLESSQRIDVVRVTGSHQHVVLPTYYLVYLEFGLSKFDARASKVVRSRRSSCPVCEGYDMESIGPITLVEETLTGQDVFQCINGYVLGLSKKAYSLLEGTDFYLTNVMSAKSRRA